MLWESFCREGTSQLHLISMRTVQQHAGGESYFWANARVFNIAAEAEERIPIHENISRKMNGCKRQSAFESGRGLGNQPLDGVLCRTTLPEG
jgi:hypothetical protein